MAIYTTIFLSKRGQLPAGFPGWKLPLSEPVTRQRVNPFTREEIVITTREPEWDDFDPEGMEIPEYQAIAVHGDYHAYLENRIAPFVQSKPHWCTKNLTSIELEPLVAIAVKNDDIQMEFALYAHPSLATCIQQFPDDFVIRLKTADDLLLRSLAEEWAGRMSTPEHTHAVGGERRLYDDWTVDDALRLLRPIVELATQQSDGQSMFLLTEA